MRIFGWIIASVLLFVTGNVATAQDYPDKSRTLRIIVSYPPGAANDILARLVGQKLQDRWGLPVIVDNRAGANGMIGAATVAKATPGLGRPIVPGKRSCSSGGRMKSEVFVSVRP